MIGRDIPDPRQVPVGGVSTVQINGHRLTPRQAQVFTLVGSGKSYVQAAAKLGIKPDTVRVFAKQVHAMLVGYEYLPPQSAIRHFWRATHNGLYPLR